MDRRCRLMRNRRRADAGQVFARNLRRLCVGRCIDAAKLAVLTGRSRRSARRMLAGEITPTLRVLARVAHRINVRVTDLLRDL